MCLILVAFAVINKFLLTMWLTYGHDTKRAHDGIVILHSILVHVLQPFGLLRIIL